MLSDEVVRDMETDVSLWLLSSEVRVCGDGERVVVLSEALEGCWGLVTRCCLYEL